MSFILHCTSVDILLHFLRPSARVENFYSHLTTQHCFNFFGSPPSNLMLERHPWRLVINARDTWRLSKLSSSAKINTHERASELFLLRYLLINNKIRSFYLRDEPSSGKRGGGSERKLIFDRVKHIGSNGGEDWWSLAGIWWFRREILILFEKSVEILDFR